MTVGIKTRLEECPLVELAITNKMEVSNSGN